MYMNEYASSHSRANSGMGKDWANPGNVLALTNSSVKKGSTRDELMMAGHRK